jgi:hypothetical protein
MTPEASADAGGTGLLREPQPGRRIVAATPDGVVLQKR